MVDGRYRAYSEFDGRSYENIGDIELVLHFEQDASLAHSGVKFFMGL